MTSLYATDKNFQFQSGLCRLKQGSENVLGRQNPTYPSTVKLPKN
jgi:hypothetical protein